MSETPPQKPGTGSKSKRRPAYDELIMVRLARIADLISISGNRTYEPQFGIRNTEHHIFGILAELDQATVSDISRRANIDKAWISRSLRQLLERGLVERNSHPRDNRYTMYSLTDKALELIDRMQPVSMERQAKLLKGLDKREVQRLLDALERNAAEL